MSELCNTQQQVPEEAVSKDKKSKVDGHLPQHCFVVRGVTVTTTGPLLRIRKNQCNHRVLQLILGEPLLRQAAGQAFFNHKMESVKEPS